MNDFFADIEKFNAMYKMEAPSVPTLDLNRAENFNNILQEEVNEFEDIFIAAGEEASESDIITMQADLYGDIIIYCASEMRRIGLDPQTVLEIIMQSNFSKLDANGLPIYDERGKVLKGPNYWKPEPMLKEYIEDAMNGEQNG